MLAVFEGNETEPLECAVAMQRRLAAEKWTAIDELRIRVAVHAGPADFRADDYFGSTVNRLARLMATAWGGQIILTPDVIAVTSLPDGATVHGFRGSSAQSFDGTTTGVWPCCIRIYRCKNFLRYAPCLRGQITYLANRRLWWAGRKSLPSSASFWQSQIAVY